MNENVLKQIKSKMNAKFYVMNDAWLRDCVEYFVTDKAPCEMTDKHIFEFVEVQWQLSDLREISNENGCLPKNLAQRVHIVLTGTYILQVDKMYDIGSSKYKQLCAIRKVSNGNLEATKEGEQVEWQPKARRMMQLCLTDGTQDVAAIEYSPLRQMTSPLLPGYKVMIIGPVDCRRGIILLEEGKYKEIGGEVESLLKANALENVLARALGEPENPDPYNDNGTTSRITNGNIQNATSTSSGKDSFFDDDFEQAVDLEEVTAIERQSQEIETVQNRFENMRDGRQMVEKVETMEEFLEDIDFEPLDNWPDDPPMRLSQVKPASRIETKKWNEKDDIMIIEEASTSAHDSCSRPLLPVNSKNENVSEFPDNDFDFDDCEIIVKTKESQSQQDGNPLRHKRGTCPLPLMPKLKLTNDIPKIKKHIFTEVSETQNENSMTKTFGNSSAPTPAPKICDVLSDVLRKPIIGKIYRTVRGRVKNHSPLTKEGKQWTVTALVADHTSNVEVCFDSEILEGFFGFTVEEFTQKKKLAKMDPQMNNELRLRFRKAQHEIQNLDALLKLELVQNQMPKIVGITQLTQQQKEDLTKRSAN